MDNAIEVKGITKKYGKVTAVDNVSFDISGGEFFGFLGPNGAGKTTLIRILTTLLEPTSGNAVVACCDVAKSPDAVRRQIGVVPQAMTSDLDLTGYENMDIYGKFYGIPGRERKNRITALLDLIGLTARAGDLVAAYSGGMRRRLEIARVLVHRPKILFLDEPTIGLDPQSRHLIWEIIKAFREENEMTVFLSTHYMEEAETLCDRVAIIDSGRIVVLGSPGELKGGLPGKDIISLATTGSSGDILGQINKLPFVHKVEHEEKTIRVYVDNGSRDLPRLLEELRLSASGIQSVTIHQQSLEDVFIHYTGRSIREEEVKKVSFLAGAGVPQKWGR